ncbi:MAG: LytTR family DNA-binding domain-containing protein [Acidobacteriota bacterium]
MKHRSGTGLGAALSAGALLGSLALAIGCAGAVGPPAEPSPRWNAQEVRWQLGDDPAWRSPGLDDRRWSRSSLRDLPSPPSVFWIRLHVELEPRHAPVGEPMALRFSALATCELFWDGVRLKTSGRPGLDADQEQPALIEALIHLPPDRVDIGRHLLAGRCSTHHRQLELNGGFMEIAVGPSLAMAGESLSYSWLAVASLSAKLLAAVYFFSVFWLGDRARAALFLGLLSLSMVGLLIAEVWRPLVGYTYDWHIPRLFLVNGMAWASNLWLLLYVLIRFPAPGRAAAGAVAGLASLGIVVTAADFDSRVAWTFVLGLGVAFGWGLGAVWRRERGGVLLTVGVGLCLAAYASNPSRFLDQGVFLAFDLLLAMLLITHVLESHRQGDLSRPAEPSPAPEVSAPAAEPDPPASEPPPPRKLRVRRGGRVELIDIESLLYIRGAGDYSALHLESGGRHLHDKSLKELEALLPLRFARVHRSYIVDLHRVRSLSSPGGGRHRIEIDGGEEIPVSRTRVEEIRRQLEAPRSEPQGTELA